VLFVTHKLDECYRIGGQAIVFRDGQCVAQGPIRGYTKTELGHLMTGKSIDGSRYRRGRPGAGQLLEVQGLGCGDHFRGVSFSVAPGEVLGITGLMDSGRNELGLALAGVLPATAGSIRLGGAAVTLARPSDAIAHGIGYVPEDRLAEGLFLDKPILANMVALVLDRLRSGFGLLDRGKSRAIAEGLVTELQIATPDVDLPVQSLSGGNQQRVLIARWLTIAPKLLLLHGPTVGVDVGSKDTIYKVMQALAEKGMALVVISDDLPELLQNCDRILVMRNGRVAADFAADEASEESLYDAMLASPEEALS
jgi:simple sugar transport system ATP-binding protein